MTCGVRYKSLSARERKVLQLVTAGLLNKQIAGEMKLSEVTVKVHRRVMMHKLGAKSLSALVRIASVMGVVPRIPSTDRRRSFSGFQLGCEVVGSPDGAIQVLCIHGRSQAQKDHHDHIKSVRDASRAGDIKRRHQRARRLPKSIGERVSILRGKLLPALGIIAGVQKSLLEGFL